MSARSFFYEVYSRSIKARAAYLMADEEIGTEIEPHDSIEVLYTPAMRRIRLGILKMDPVSRTRCAAVRRAATIPER